MSRIWKPVTIVSLGLWVAGAAAARVPDPESPRPVAARRLASGAVPGAFGTEDLSVTVLSAAKFLPRYMSPNLSGYCPPVECQGGEHWFATVNLPAGTVIEYIGVNSATTVDAAMGFTLHFRDHLGGTAPLASASFPAHDFATDRYGPLNILIPGNIDRVFLLDLEVAPGLPATQYFGFVEIWWRRVVSDPPSTPRFVDVPNSHPFYPFVEALAASGITAGCGDGTNFCPNDPLTRGQMAVFLARALGLHWPN